MYLKITFRQSFMIWYGLLWRVTFYFFFFAFFFHYFNALKFDNNQLIFQETVLSNSPLFIDYIARPLHNMIIIFLLPLLFAGQILILQRFFHRRDIQQLFYQETKIAATASSVGELPSSTNTKSPSSFFALPRMWVQLLQTS